MSDEVPPSSLVTRPEPPEPETIGARYTLRLTTRRWAAIPYEAPSKAAVMVLGAWLVLAWNRFGFQGLAQPRVMLRFVLVGVYGWLGLVAVVWLGHKLRNSWGGTEAQRLLQVIGLSHLALVMLAIVIQIGQAIPIPFVVPVLTVFALLIWFPGMLIAAVAQTAGHTAGVQGGSFAGGLLAGGRSAALSLMVTVFAYLVWLATVGRYLFDQLAHLI